MAGPRGLWRGALQPPETVAAQGLEPRVESGPPSAFEACWFMGSLDLLLARGVEGPAVPSPRCDRGRLGRAHGAEGVPERRKWAPVRVGAPTARAQSRPGRHWAV